ncbi:MAG: ABC transporter permease, partial [Acidobacteriota bacterium]|nr:ABC transporter permease [Acidobacteriota bacterium]
MRKRPGFTAVVIVTLAIGIGATTAMFGTIHAALLSSLPFDEPDRLVMGRATFGGQVNPWVSGYDYYDYRDQSESFEYLSAFMYGGRLPVLAGAEPVLAASAFCTWDLFHSLRTRPAAGRLFVSSEGVEDGPNVVMVSYAFWQTRLGGAPDVAG